jgi:hypothetical protein
MATTAVAARKGSQTSKIQFFWIGCAGALGALLAIVADIIQKEDASAVMEVHDALSSTLRLPLPPLAIAALLMTIGIGLCFINETGTPKAAFAKGASVLAVLMTFVPYKAPPAIPTSPEQAPIKNEASGLWETVVFAQTPPSPEPRFRIDLHLLMPDGSKVASAVYTLRDPASRAIIARTNGQGSDFTFYVTSRSYVLQVQAPNCSLAEKQLSIHSPQSVTITLSPSSIPIWVQRILVK